MNPSVEKALKSSFAIWMFIAVLMVGYLYRWGKNDIRFGIDLVGGTYITLEVDEHDVIKNYLNEKVRSFETVLKQEKISLESQPIVVDGALLFKFSSSSDAQAAQNLFKGEEKQIKADVNGNTVKVTVSSLVLSHLLEESVDANIEILRSRFDNLSEIHISKQGDKQIVVELPDVKDPQEAKQMIGKSAVLDFKLVEDMSSSREALLEKYDQDLPEGTMILPGRRQSKFDERTTYYLVPTYTPVSGNYLKHAKVDFTGGEFKTEIGVAFEFDKEGSKRFHELTAANIGRQLAIVLDGEVISAPSIRDAINGSGFINGSFGQAEARTLAKLLKSGSFKAKVNFIEERQIGPTLGQESIYQGLLSCVIGLILLLFFGVFNYRLCGVFSFVTLIYNLLLLLVFMALMRATLTLPGIAGMVLTIGMAIDSSILIFERIKETIRNGMAVSAAVEDGFQDAMWVILDSNITTFMVAAVLYYFGTGPIQGFAVTMMIGIITTLLTGLSFLKSLFRFYLKTFHVQKLNI